MTEHVQRRDTADVAEATGRLIRAIGRRVAREDVEQLEHLQQLEDALKAAWEDAITGLRHNYSDKSISRQLGVTRQAVSQRWPRPAGRELIEEHHAAEMEALRARHAAERDALDV